MADAPILITGGAGFIGSNPVDALLARGYAVRVLDNLSTGKRENLPQDERVELIVGDVADAECVRRSVQGCRAVVHLAAVASVQASVDDPLGTHQSNLIGTLNLCEAMREAGVKRVLFASSAAVYGNNGEGQAIDEGTAKAPLTPTPRTSWPVSTTGFLSAPAWPEPVVFRFFNVYGLGRTRRRPIPGDQHLYRAGAEGRPIAVFGDGEQTRDFIYVGDLVEVLVQALEAADAPEGAVNVGLNKATSLNQLLDAIGDVLGDLPEVSYQAARSGDIRHSRANNARLVQRYRVPEPPTSMREGLARLLGK